MIQILSMYEKLPLERRTSIAVSEQSRLVASVLLPYFRIPDDLREHRGRIKHLISSVVFEIPSPDFKEAIKSARILKLIEQTDQPSNSEELAVAILKKLRESDAVKIDQIVDLKTIVDHLRKTLAPISLSSWTSVD